jgi:hypothetical protein
VGTLAPRARAFDLCRPMWPKTLKRLSSQCFFRQAAGILTMSSERTSTAQTWSGARGTLGSSRLGFLICPPVMSTSRLTVSLVPDPEAPGATAQLAELDLGEWHLEMIDPPQVPHCSNEELRVATLLASGELGLVLLCEERKNPAADMFFLVALESDS